jgi:16S rRNA U516 pseudouridylate synthase RsuA-like enzyme
MLLRHFLQLHGYSRRKILWFIQQGTLFVDEQRVDSLKKELSFGQTVRVEKKNYMYTNSPTEY